MRTVKEVANLFNARYNKFKKSNNQVKDQQEKNFIEDKLINTLKDDLQINKGKNELEDIMYIELLIEQLTYEREYNQEELVNKEKEIEGLYDLLIEYNRIIENFLRFKARVEEVSLKMELARQNMRNKEK
ncbi:hypothetical protein [Metaclostridioides mangenotii]|uniref:Long-subunit acyl-CoA synthetase (AMP-forming) n=1 Tax=Metaclostridioides mangenotii TaxID=1540 RepID=A0ABS4EAU7_9FIRM|nr:hypothetical protein [Clostridioides mangenotii]MBP1855049.1 long-subunit acyl-CoA synthetase (AMP-forming) [Clostridioides mangenotii]